MRLKGNKILITGATSGIGESLLYKFLNLDNQIIAVGRNEKKLKELERTDKRIIPFACDVSKAKDLIRLETFVKQEHQDTNILINNAAVQYNYDFTEHSGIWDKIDREVHTNFTAPLKIIAALLPVISLNPNAAIVNITSGLAFVPKKQAPVYCGTKGGLHIFSKSLREQLPGINVFEVIPPVTDTPMTAGRGKQKISPEQLTEEFIRGFRKNRFEINIGKVKLLRLINRISPSAAENIIRRIS